MKKNTYSLLAISLAFVASLMLSSCISGRKLAYFNNIQRDSSATINEQRLEAKINVGDLLQINISTPDQITTAILNSATAINSGQGGVSGYLVDETGNIKLPLLGTVKAEGLTKIQLANFITTNLLDNQLAKSPIVNVRIVNFKVTVLGEVGRPGVISVPNERITLPEALASAGDLTSFGKRNNVLLIREVDGKRTWTRFSLNESQLFDKGIYNLQNEDIIYVEPNSAKAASSDRTTQLIPYFFSTASLLIVIYLQFIKK
ncbi:polysaccharide biosynthesis/export family protein [Mucilaginibacter psychrotolerans]|uniref:Polysaccharide export protein n=1 Tax=Mucilaginibacter psychrotolerans TaxID=1524096 RepID=A0A4Y8SJX3_9SPHI|nr:polysaccharide biosynthesis/export family protein [Mucilaginibacter psychrotolerans]TFF38827.1 polysaccharide export protein [Mucilaginibacter psychrotolerans]